MKTLTPEWLCCLLLLVPTETPAQSERFELGLRLRAFEAAWEQQPDAAARRRAVPPLKMAVRTFFSLKLGEAGRALDQARLALQSVQEPPEAVRWAASLSLRLDSRFVEGDAEAVAFSLQSFYPPVVEIPAAARLRLSVADMEAKTVRPLCEVPITQLPWPGNLPLQRVEAGDYILRMEILQSDQLLARSEQTLSRAANLTNRLKHLRKWAEALPREPATTEKETVRSLAKLVSALADKQALETNYPAARLLEEAEAVGKSFLDGPRFYSPKRPGQFWLTLAAAKSLVPVRLLIPDAAVAGKPLPLVVALHGAGGSENLFFDGYGNGAIVRLCQERGWLLAAPRSSGLSGAPLGETIDALAELYPVDKQRVYVVGHSMGAAQAVAAAQQSPERFRAVAALGGGGRVSKMAASADLPFFVGVGTEDFALAGARSLHASLQNAGVTNLQLR